MSHYSNIEDLLAEDCFVRWITGSATAEEQVHWEQWVAGDPARQMMVREAEKWHKALYYDQIEAPRVETERSKLMSAIHRHEASKKTIGQFSANKKKGKHFWVRVAAILLLATVVGWGIYMGVPKPKPEKGSEIQWVVSKTEYGEKRKLQLSDGSKIMLNAHSQLKYPKRQSSGKDLQVWLEGEAYFDIAHKAGVKLRQFTVHTTDGEVRVLGTHFNVNTGNEQTEVVLERGRVEIEKTDSTALAPVTRVMEPGERARFAHGQNPISIESINPELYTSWTRDRLVFEETSLQEIGMRIQAIYGLKVQIATPDLAQTLVSGTMSNDNLPVLLASLSRLLSVNIDRKEKLILIKK